MSSNSGNTAVTDILAIIITILILILITTAITIIGDARTILELQIGYSVPAAFCSAMDEGIL
jgi:hypothetical protein